MFGALKKLFFKPSSAPSPVAIAPAPVAVAEPQRPPPPPVAPPAPPPPAPVPVLNGDLIQLPLNEIVSRLPASIGALAVGHPGGVYSLPVSMVMDQLRTGAVRVPFGQLRRDSPPGTFTVNSSFDESLIDLPMGTILAALGPAALARRRNQARLEAPDSVSGIFGPKGTRVETPDTEPEPIAPTPLKMPEVAKSFAPIPMSVPSLPKPTTSIAHSFTPMAPAVTAPSSLPFVCPTPPPPAPSGETLSVAFEAVAEGWPESIRQEISQLNLGVANVAIPLSSLEAAMKTGRVLFTWGEVRSWLNQPHVAPSGNASVAVEFPLKVIAPLFMAARQPSTAKKKIIVGENIPNLFDGIAKGTFPAAPASPSAPPVPVVPPLAPAPPDALGEIFGQPSRRDWTPPEIAQQISALDGVTACVIATSDGLLVAGQVPAPWKAETLAGFLPQMFTRLAHYSEEAQLGALRSLTLQTGQAPWAIFQAGTLFLAVLGQPGHALPETILQRISTELAKRKP